MVRQLSGGSIKVLLNANNIVQDGEVVRAFRKAFKIQRTTAVVTSRKVHKELDRVSLCLCELDKALHDFSHVRFVLVG